MHAPSACSSQIADPVSCRSIYVDPYTREMSGRKKKSIAAFLKDRFNSLQSAICYTVD